MAELQRAERRHERLGFRVDRRTKALIERAAELEQRKLTDYCLSALREAATRTIEEHETIRLSAKDRAVFFDVLTNPPPVNDRLRKAFREHRRRTAT